MRMGLYKKRIVGIFGLKKIILLIFLSVTMFFLWLFCERIYPNYISRIEIYAENLAVSAINSTLAETLQNFETDKYFSNVGLDNDGTISSIEENTGRINLFKAEYVKLLQEKINNLPKGYITIPLGSLFEKEFLSGFGPEIKIKTAPYGVVRADFEEEFTACGINQVKHKIFLNVNVKITMVSATMRKSKNVNETVPISETVISGTVPKYYGSGTGIAAIKND